MRLPWPRLAVAQIALSSALAFAQAPQPPAGAPFQLAGKYYKNIQVLQDIPADQMLSTMLTISESLGVKCTFCHVTKDFASDPTAMKNKTRQMLRMTAAINKTTFGGAREITCFTCHRGSTNPEGVPLVPGQGWSSQEAVRISAGKLPSSEQILQKYIAALGGVKAIQGMTTLVGNGTATDSAGRKFPFEIYAKPPDKRLLIRHQPGRDVPLGYNGNYGWLMDIAGDFRFMRSEELDEYKLEDIFYFPLRLREMVSPLRVEGIAKISGRDSYVVSGRTRILPLVKLYFDKESGLLVRVLEHIDSAAGPYPTQVDIADYRNAGGLRIPFRWTLGQINVEGGPITYQVDHLQENVPVADSKFNKPGARAAEPAKSGSQHGN